MTSTPGIVEQVVGGPDVLAVTVGATTVGVDEVVDAVTITNGRADADSQPDPAVCSLVVLASALPTLPTVTDDLVVELGADAIAWLGLSGSPLAAARSRFTGQLTDIVPVSASSASPALVRLVAAGRRSRLNVKIGAPPWPAELDGARAARILALAAAQVDGLDVGTIDPGTVTVLALDVDRQPAADLLADLAASSAALLVERRDGELRWQDAEHRSTRTPAVTLTDRDILAPLIASQTRAGLVNDLRLTYGPDEPGADRPQVRVTDPVSVDQHGPFDPDGTTQLAAEADAEALGRLIVGRRARPAYRLPALTVDLVRRDAGADVGVDATTAALLLQLEVSDLVAVSGLPTSGPFAVPSGLWLEGWTETVSRHSWRLQLNVTARGLTGTPDRWSDVHPDTTWNDLPADLTWLTAAGYDFAAG